MPKNDKKTEKQESSREKSSDKKKGKKDAHQDQVSPSGSKDSISQGKKNKKEKDDDDKCYTVKSTPSHMAQCSNEQFLSSCLPLLATLSAKKNFLARINIQKALYEAIDENDDDDSDDECCSQPRKVHNACNIKGGKKDRRNS